VIRESGLDGGQVSDDKCSVLLSYSVPTWKVRRYFLKLFLTMLAVYVGLLAVSMHLFRRMGWVFLAIYCVIPVCVLLSENMSITVAGFECSASGIVLQVFRGRKFDIPWNQIKQLRIGGGLWNSSSLSVRDQRHLNLSLIPKGVLQELVLLMQETSDARIIGV